MNTKNFKIKKCSFKMDVKSTLIYVLIGMLSMFSISCGGNDDGPSDLNPGAAAADITLTAGGQEFKVVGPCGWAVAGGANYIGANHAANSLRTFSAFFNITTLPTVTTTYTLVESSTDTNPNHINMNISEIAGSTLTEWSSKDTSGTLTLMVNGNTVTANLAGITLYPQTTSGVFTNGNVGAFANNGALTGTLIFYRQ